MGIPISRPLASTEELEAVKNVLLSNYWGCGKEVSKFEQEFAELLGVQHCVATNSCTSALHLAGKLLDLEVGSEVIVPAITWIATAYLAEYNNLKVVFADVNRETLVIDPDDIVRKISPKTKAIVVMHHGGHACDMDKIIAITKNYNLTLVEDCAHSLGGSFNNKLLGTFGDLACFSFHPAKNISTGDGGMLVVNSEKLLKRALSLRYFGIDRDVYTRMVDHKYNWQHDILEVGYKYYMNNLAAAIGRVQLKRLTDYNAKRQQIVSNYQDYLNEISWITLPIIRPNVVSANYLYCIKVPSDCRDQLIKLLTLKGIDVGVHYKPLYQHTIYKGYDADCPIADEVWQQLISLPIYPGLSMLDQFDIIKIIKSFRTNEFKSIA